MPIKDAKAVRTYVQIPFIKNGAIYHTLTMKLALLHQFIQLAREEMFQSLVRKTK